jgi:hypothetical protein
MREGEMSDEQLSIHCVYLYVVCLNAVRNKCSCKSLGLFS